MSYLSHITIANPKHKFTQQQVFDVVKNTHAQNAIEERALRFRYNNSGIDHRYITADIYEKSEHNIFNAATEVDTQTRMKLYNAHAFELCTQAIDKLINAAALQQITHIITVSCTGMSAPGLDLQLVEYYNLSNTLNRSSINFMGCYAAVHALKQAYYIAKAEQNAKVLIVCVELCTLHFQKSTAIDNITSTIIFGDGACAFMVSSKQEERSVLKLAGFYSKIIGSGKQEMAWDISNTGFLMTLTKRVPELLKDNIVALLKDARSNYKLEAHDPLSLCVHPGGKKILEAVSDGLALSKYELQASYETLKNFGNMSSPTIMFVLKNMIEAQRNKQPILGMSFGPGLTLETFYATYVS